jgi:protein TonB
VRIGGNIRAPKLVYEVRPVYPPLAVQSRVQGTVVIEAHVGVDGLVRSARVLRGQLLLDDAALQAVRQRRYQPLLLNGVPTEFILTMTMVFQLTKAQPGL